MSMHASIGGERYGGPPRAPAIERPRAAVRGGAGVSAVDLVGIDRVLRAFYAALRARPEPRWHALRALFEPGSRVRLAPGVEVRLEEYVRRVRDGALPAGMVEVDRAARVEGELAFVASAWRAPTDGGATVLGVNEFLLRKAEARWRVAGSAGRPARSAGRTGTDCATRSRVESPAAVLILEGP
jgi:hypothetical protein